MPLTETLDPFEGLDDDLDQAPMRRGKPANEQKFPCQSCAGTGRFQGTRIHQEKSECFACAGRGWFRTSHADRQKAREKAATRKRTKLQEALDAFNEQHPGLVERARKVADWHGFAREMIAKLDQYGSLSDRQVEALVASLDKADAGRARKQAERASFGGAVDVAAISALFDKAKSSGLKRPVFRTEHLDLSLASPTGKNPGAIYVKQGETYLGKIAGGQFIASRDANETTYKTLTEVASQPLETAVKYGRLTGRCGCCGRTLTDPESVRRGIGPICADNWGI